MSEIDDLLAELTGPKAAGAGDAPGPQSTGPQSTGPQGNGDQPPPGDPGRQAADPESQRARDAGIVAVVGMVLVLLLGGGYLISRPRSSDTAADGTSTTGAAAASTGSSVVGTGDPTTTAPASGSVTTGGATTGGATTGSSAAATAPSTAPAGPGGPAATAGPTTAVDPATAVRSVVVDAQKVHLKGRVATQADVERIAAAYTQRWGASAVVNELVVDPTAPAAGPVPVILPVTIVFPSGSYTVPSKYRWMLGVAADLLTTNPGLTLRATIYAAGDEKPQQAAVNAQHRLDALQQVLRTAGVPAAQLVDDLRPGPAPAGATGDPDRSVQLTVNGFLPS